MDSDDDLFLSLLHDDSTLNKAGARLQPSVVQKREHSQDSNSADDNTSPSKKQKANPDDSLKGGSKINASNGDWMSKKTKSPSPTKSAPKNEQPSSSNDGKKRTTIGDYFAKKPETKSPSIKSEITKKASPAPAKVSTSSTSPPAKSDTSKKKNRQEELMSFLSDDYDTVEVDHMADVRRKKAQKSSSDEDRPLSLEELLQESDEEAVKSKLKMNKPPKEVKKETEPEDSRWKVMVPKPVVSPNSRFSFTMETMKAAPVSKIEKMDIQKTITPPKKTAQSQLSFTRTSPIGPLDNESTGSKRTFFYSSRYIPEQFTNAALVENFEDFKNSLETIGESVVLAAIYKYNTTSFRNPTDKKKEPELARASENIIGYCILASQTKRHFFLPFRESDVAEETVAVKDRLECLINFVENDLITKICYDCQNALKFLFEAKPGLLPSNFVDPKVAAWIYEPELDSYEFAEVLCHFTRTTESKTIDTNIGKLPADISNCFTLWSCLEELLKKEMLLDAFIHQEMKAAFVLSKMEIDGIAFDSVTLTKHRKNLQERIAELQSQADKMLGHPILLSSPKQVSEALFDELKLTTGDKLLKGNKGHMKKSNHSNQQHSTSEAVLTALKSHHPLPGIILEFRHCQKLLGNWVDALEKKAVPSKVQGTYPRVHTTWVHTGTATGRLASQNPNMQNLPKLPISLKGSSDGSDASSLNIRDAFCSDEGLSLVAFDYSQLEMRILAHMSKDQYLLQFFREKQDIHKLIASRWLGKPPEKVSKEEREQAKRIVYGILYGIGPSALADMLEISIKEASKFIDTFLGKFPSVQKFLSDTIATARREKSIKTLVQRRRLLPDINHHEMSKRKRSERQATNSVIQGTAADVVKLAMVEAADELLSDPRCSKTKMLLQIHDELVFEVDDENLQYVVPKLKSIMENVLSLEVELPVSASVGRRWGSLKEFVEGDHENVSKIEVGNNAAIAQRTKEKGKADSSPTPSQSAPAKKDSPAKKPPTPKKQNTPKVEKPVRVEKGAVNSASKSTKSSKKETDSFDEDLENLLFLKNHDKSRAREVIEL
eukprot:TRINITY_DN11625_c0_g1_i1.p1 TRINITY_DN11625_c0_g1~~TRINITY_DN11625_c0_g1_i1.p1  ORF type:complete len:1080 (+),score=278.54 TRINITY_DN11625_c0_g1_i1:64-3240(+)